MIESGQQARALFFDDGDRETSAKLIEDKASFIVRNWAALHLSSVSCFGSNKTFEEFMEILRDFTILSSDKAYEISISFQAFFRGTYLRC